MRHSRRYRTVLHQKVKADTPCTLPSYCILPREVLGCSARQAKVKHCISALVPDCSVLLVLPIASTRVLAKSTYLYFR